MWRYAKQTARVLTEGGPAQALAPLLTPGAARSAARAPSPHARTSEQPWPTGRSPAGDAAADAPAGGPASPIPGAACAAPPHGHGAPGARDCGGSKPQAARGGADCAHDAGGSGVDPRFVALPRLPLPEVPEHAGARPVPDPGAGPGTDPGGTPAAVRGLALVDWPVVAGGPPARAVLWYDRAGWLHLAPLPPA